MVCAIDAIICTASTGCFPTAVSWESITASVPSKIALATSATSARVGRVEWTIDSSIWVAVIVGLAWRPATASSRFCTSGTSSIGSSMPRSPRAIMMPSAAWMISSPFAAACGFSIFAISGTSTPRVFRCSRTGSRSSRRRTNESAKKSTPMSRPTSISPMSSSLTAGSETVTFGRLSPCREATLPPTSTLVTTSPSRTSATRSRTAPSAR